MQFGFVRFNHDEQKKVAKVLQLLRDERAIDELGIGRLRDAFSNRMFPGMSQLQNHAKYFVLLPSLYYQAQKKTYKNDKEVRDEITRMEINLTKQLLEGTSENQRLGITGSDTVEAALKDINRYVKYDPTYIYQSGLLTYGIIKHQGNLYACIREQSQKLASRPKLLKRSSKDDEADDVGGVSETRDYFSTTGEHYDFSTHKGEIKISLELSPCESVFLKRHIETSSNSSDSLLAYILRNNLPIDWREDGVTENVFENYDSLDDIWKKEHMDVPEKYLRPYKLSLQFSRFVYLLRIVYEIAYTERTERNEDFEVAKRRWEEVIGKPDYRNAARPEVIESILTYFAEEVNECSLLTFCREGAVALTNYFNEPCESNLDVLKKLVESRERRVKGERRSKLLHPAEYSNVRHGIGQPLSYRWLIVRRMISEIRTGLKRTGLKYE